MKEPVICLFILLVWWLYRTIKNHGIRFFTAQNIPSGHIFRRYDERRAEIKNIHSLPEGEIIIVVGHAKNMRPMIQFLSHLNDEMKGIVREHYILEGVPPLQLLQGDVCEVEIIDSEGTRHLRQTTLHVIKETYSCMTQKNLS